MKICRQVSPHGRAALLLVASSLVACGDETPVEGDASGMPSDASKEVRDEAGLDACVAQPFLSANRDVDLLFAVATSASMSTIDGDAAQGSRWDGASSAISSFVTSLADRHFGGGMLFFPLLTTGGDAKKPVEVCTRSDYQTPVVAIAPFEADGAHAAAFDLALGSRSLQGGNAMGPALGGALDRAARRKGMSGHIVHTVLVTDGAPDPCAGGSIDAGESIDAIGAARDAYLGNHLETYVLGIGPDAQSLDPIAASGGTFHGYAAASGDDVAPVLATMGAAMRRCHFYFPMVLAPNDALRVTIAIDHGTSNAELVARFDNGNLCGPSPGWFFDSAGGPAYATFCPAVCDDLLAHPERVVSAWLGCLSSIETR